MSQEAESVTYRVEDHVAVITLNRPEQRNALNFDAYDRLERAFRQAVRDPDARCVIVTGADPAFCSGDDVREIMAGPRPAIPPPPTVRHAPTPAAMAALECDKPVIAAVNGAAVGWGMELALMADIRVASERAKFGELFVLRGLCSDVPGIGRLAHLVGRERAAEMLFTGDVIDASTAEQWGLVSRLVPHDELLSVSMALAQRIAERPPLAVQQLKAGMRRALDPDWRELGEWVSTTLGRLFRTDDHREGVRAFLEKRPPRFTGR